MISVNKNDLENLVFACYEKHKEAYEVWENGKPIRAYFDLEGLVIHYESGKWWHYKPINETNIEWW